MSASGLAESASEDRGPHVRARDDDSVALALALTPSGDLVLTEAADIDSVERAAAGRIRGAFAAGAPVIVVSGA